MKSMNRGTRFLSMALVSLALAACGGSEGDSDKTPGIPGRLVAVGIPGAGAIAPVGRFLPGGPINDNAAFKAYTETGKVLDPQRLLVASTSNFGQSTANKDDMPGSLLSIDASGSDVLQVPADFATAGGQAATLDGKVRLYTSQSGPFLNSVTSPQAVTASQAAVSNIQDLSINNAFGRLWPANAPRGLDKPGSETILDPGGMPLANAPAAAAGGVFFGDLTGRKPKQVTPGALSTAAVGTAFLGRALDDPRRAVFAVVTADGAVLQAHTEQGVDGLAPSGTISDLRSKPADGMHVGAVLKYYTADPVLYVSDPVKNEIVAITTPKDEVGMVRKAGTIQRFQNPAFNQPVDLAPTIPEGNHRDWASNTSLAELADIYVLNRGNNTISRMKVDGSVIATRKVTLPENKSLGSAKVNGIATSMDGSKIYVSVTGKLPGYQAEGALLELASFSN
jgi:hypothetical protein